MVVVEKPAAEEQFFIGGVLDPQVVSGVAVVGFVDGTPDGRAVGAGADGGEYKGDAWGGRGSRRGRVRQWNMDLAFLCRLVAETTGSFRVALEVLLLMRRPG